MEKRTAEPAAAHLETTRPSTDPTAIGRSRRWEGVSPSLRRAMRRPPKNHVRHEGGMLPLKAKRIRALKARAPRPAIKDEVGSRES